MRRSSPDGQRWFYAYLPNGMAGGTTSPLIPLFTRVLGGSVADVGAGAAAGAHSCPRRPPFARPHRPTRPYARAEATWLATNTRNTWAVVRPAASRRYTGKIA